jgi:hypothetical protein
VGSPPSYAALRAGNVHGDGEGSIFAWMIRKMLTPDDLGIALDVNPDYQRGHVWTEAQSAAFVGHKLEGGECPTLTIQRWAAPVSAVDELVDGKQRLLAILGFVEDRIPALLSDGRAYHLRAWSPDDQRTLPRAFELMLRARYVSCRSRADVLRLYLRLNRGGSVHTDEEIERVRTLLRSEAP